MGREVGARSNREGTYAYLWLIHVDIWQKTIKFCKAITLQLKNKLIKKKKDPKLPVQQAQLQSLVRELRSHMPHGMAKKMCVWVAYLCLTLCDPIDCSWLVSCVHGILLARILEWVAIPSSRGSSRTWDQTCVSCIADRFFIIWATREVPPQTMNK